MKRNRVSFPTAALCIFAALVFSTAALAADYYWDAASGDWSVGTNWDPEGPPIAIDTAHIDNGGTANIAAFVNVSRVVVNDGIINQSADSLYSGNGIGLYATSADTTAVYNFSGDYINTSSIYIQDNLGNTNAYFNMTGGQIDTGMINLGSTTTTGNGDLKYGGEFYISNGTLNVNEIDVGYGMDSLVNFYQSGGTVNIADELYVGNYGGNFGYSNGYYHMSGGTLSVGGDLIIGAASDYDWGWVYGNGGSDSALYFSGGTIAVDGDMFIGADGCRIDDTGHTSAAITVGGSFINYSDNNEEFEMRHTALTLHAGVDCTVLNMNSTDMGAKAIGLDDNFAIGRIVFAANTPGTASYQLQSDLYCYGVEIQEDVTIYLNGYKIYYLSAEVGSYNGIDYTPSIFNGTCVETVGTGGVFAITAIPEPCTIALLAAGALGLAGVIRKRK